MMKPNEQAVHCRDIDIAYSECGEGAPLILLHGNGEDRHVFDGILSPLTQRFHVYALDTRGHGQTSRGIAPFSINTFADDLLCFMDALGIERAHIVGFSDGGNIAMTFALSHNNRLSSLVLIGANCFPAGTTASALALLKIGEGVLRITALFSAQAREKLPFLRLMTNEPRIAFHHLHRIEVPCLVLVGQRDMIRPEHSRAMADALPQGRLCVLPGRDHFAVTKAPREVTAALIEFWDSL